VLFGAAISAPDTVHGSYSDKSLAGLEQATGSDWPAWGGTHAGRRFSRLDQITPDNVGGLQRAWVAHTGDLPAGAGKGKYAPETTPLKIGNHLYLCSAMNILIAFDARTGQELWRFDPKVSTRWIPYSATCRGVAAYRKAAPAAVESLPNAGSKGIQTVPAQDVTAVAASGTACSLGIIEGTLDGRLTRWTRHRGGPVPILASTVKSTSNREWGRSTRGWCRSRRHRSSCGALSSSASRFWMDKRAVPHPGWSRRSMR